MTLSMHNNRRSTHFTPVENPRRRGFTLVEQVVSLGVFSALMTGLGSVVILASTALPNKETPRLAVVQASQIVEQLAAELQTANSISERTPTSITFTVADRNQPPDGVDETIRYAWSGVAGEPLTRRYNAALAVEVAPSVKAFNLDYLTQSTTTSTTTESTVDDPEQVVASFDGWTGILATNVDQTLSNTNYVSEFFMATPPADATQLRITRARVLLKRGATAPANFTIGIRRSLGDGTYKPDSTAIGTPATILGTSLLTSYQWVTANYSDVVVTDFSRTDFCLVVMGGAPPTSFYAQVYSSLLAPANQVVLRWSTDSALSWLPAILTIHQQDLRFYVYGIYTRATKDTLYDTKDALSGVSISLRTGDEAATKLDTMVHCVNNPDVTGL